MLSRLLRRAPDGVQFPEYLDGDGAVLLEQVCKMGLEGIVPAGA
jgi:ATP-dependent DNA ligase